MAFLKLLSIVWFIALSSSMVNAFTITTNTKNKNILSDKTNPLKISSYITPSTYSSQLLYSSSSSDQNKDTESTSTNKDINLPYITSLNGVDQFLDFLQDVDDGSIGSMDAAEQNNSVNENDEQEEGEEKSITVIRFYADWCKSCQRFKPRYERIIKQTLNEASAYSSSPSSNNNLHAYELYYTNTTSTTTILSSQNKLNTTRKRIKFRFADVDYTKNTALCKTIKVNQLPCIFFYEKTSLKSKIVGQKKIQVLEQKVNSTLRDMMGD